VNDQTPSWVRSEPGKPTLEGVNWGGLSTLYIKEVRRFFKVQMQTVWAPAVTTLLYLIIFTVAMGRSGKLVLGVPFADFIAPGLIVMAMLQNSFANSDRDRDGRDDRYEDDRGYRHD
jgi:ABC-2 type transport system permease protein